MAILVDLAQLKRVKEVEWRRKITWQEIREKTGLGFGTIGQFLAEDSGRKLKRVDLANLDKICKYFGVPSGLPVPFFIFVDDSPSPDTEVPNQVTRETFAKTDAGQELVHCRDATEMFERLGI